MVKTSTLPALLDRLRTKNLTLATAESCTGGMLAKLITDIPGSSDVFDCGFITYSNASKTKMLGVPENMIREHGAVSPQVAKAMAKGVLDNSTADIAVSITGIAGPGGGSTEKPVGLVFTAFAIRKKTDIIVEKNIFHGNRDEVRKQTCIFVLKKIEEII